MNPGAFVAVLLCFSAPAPDALANRPPIPVTDSGRLSLDSLISSGRDQSRRLRLLADLAQADQDAASKRLDRLRALLTQGRASPSEVQSSSVTVQIAKDRAETLRRVAKDLDAALVRFEPTGDGPAPTLHLKLPAVSRRVGGLEFFTIPIADDWSPALALPPVPDVPEVLLRSPHQVWRDRLEAIRAIPSALPTEVLRAERDLLAAELSRDYLQTSASQNQREASALRILASSLPGKRKPLPVTRDDLGVFVSSWRRPVPCTEPFLRASLPLLQAKANAGGRMALRQQEAKRSARRVQSLSASVKKGWSGKAALLRAEADWRTATARAEFEALRNEARAAELAFFLRFAKMWDVAPDIDAGSHPADLAAALVVRSPLDSTWCHGIFQLFEKRALAQLESRTRARLEEEASRRLGALQSLAAVRPGELASARESLEELQSHLRVADEAAEIARLEWQQWIAIASLDSTSSEGYGIPASVIEEATTLADLEVRLARKWADSHQPESDFRNHLAQQLSELHRNGATSEYEAALARQELALADAKWSAARHDLRVALEQQRLLNHLAAQGDNYFIPADLGAAAQTCLSTLNHLKLQPRSGELDGMRALASMARMRGNELTRLVQGGHATSHEAEAQLAAATHFENLASLEEARTELATLADAVLGAAFSLPQLPPAEWKLPPLE